MLGQAHFSAAGVAFESYPFRSAYVFPAGVLPLQAIREVLPNAIPPELRTHTGEVLFVAAEQKTQLITWAAEHGLACVRRIDTWSLILEPYLDTEFSVAEQQATLAQLEKCGISAAECEALRAEVGAAMMAYNFQSMLWDWVHLGLYDLLCALSGHPFPKHRLNDDRFTHFYRRAMELAERGYQYDTTY